MYPKKRLVIKGSLWDIDDLNLYDPNVIEKKVEEGDLDPVDGAILMGNLEGNKYTEEEEEEEDT